jgi:hypothetical protein
MLATSSSEDDDTAYDAKKTAMAMQSGRPPPSQHSSFMPKTPQAQQRNTTQGMQNMNLNGGDQSGSNENLSMSGRQAQPPGSRNNPMSPAQARQASFKSTSSSSTNQGPPGSNSLRPNHLTTARHSPRKSSNANRSNSGRQLPRRPGDNSSYNSSVNDKNGPDYDSDNSDYQYDNYNNPNGQNNNQYYQPSDEEEDNENGNSNNIEGGSRSTMMSGGNENDEHHGMCHSSNTLIYKIFQMHSM